MMEIHAIKAFYAADGLVELEDDVLSIIRQVRELYGQRIKICWEPHSERFIFSEMCDDGAERLIFTTEELDGRALERLLQADSRSRSYEDAYDRQEREHDEASADLEEADRDRLRDHGERLAHALKRDGIGPHPLKVAVSRSLDGTDDAD